MKKAVAIGEDSIKTKDFSSLELSTLYYFLSNAWGNIEDLEQNYYQNWESDEEHFQIFYLRKSLNSDINEELIDERKSEILTNLGNSYSRCGRCIEAIENYNKVLEIKPQFGMALGNKGLAIYYYGQMLNDRCQVNYFFTKARKILSNSISLVDDPYSKQIFIEQMNYIHINCNNQCQFDKTDSDYSSCESIEEKNYRVWVFNQKLFLNPLNDICDSSGAKEDNIILPSMTAKNSDPLKYNGFYNQLKQEFITSRFLFFEGINKTEPHFSDKNVRMINTLDYPEYAFNIELIKISYRVAYSLFDKIAFFLNDYFKVGVEEKYVNFNTIWFKDRNRNHRKFRDNLKISHNPGLKALFWISKDLFDDKSGFTNEIEPEAQKLHNIRNHLEHKYLKLHSDIGFDKSLNDLTESVFFADKLAYSMYRSEFEKKTFKLLKLVRAALMYLVFSIKFEEKRRSEGKEKNLPIIRLYPLKETKN